MQNPLARERYESTVVLGFVFSPLQLGALPFLETRPQQVAAVVAALALAALTGLGALLFRKQSLALPGSKLQLQWAMCLSAGAALASILTGAFVASAAYGVWFGLAYSTVFVVAVSSVLVAANRVRPVSPTHVNSRTVGISSALGAAICPFLALALGKPFFASIAALLHLVAGVVAAINMSKFTRCAGEA